MKILQINSVCGIGSTGRICTDLAEVLEAQGHECKIAYGRGQAPEKHSKYAIRIGTDLGVNLHALGSRIFDNSGFGSKQATIKLIKWIKNWKPDRVHLHNLHGYYINVELLFEYLKTSEIPAIWTLHDCWSFTGHCAHFDFIGCNRWLMGCCRCPQKKQYPSSICYDNSIENYKRKKQAFTGAKNLTIVTPSEWLASLVKKSFFKEYPVYVIPNGIDLQVFKLTKSNFREIHNLQNKKIILGVANVWDARKGLEDFMQLSTLLDEEFKIVLVGLSNKQMQRLPKGIIGITKTNNVSELAEIYSAADVFVNPTYEDTYPTVNLESIACGTPVITYNTGGSPEAIDKTCGLVVKKSQVQYMKDAINLAIQTNFEEKNCLLKSEIFDKTHMFKKYLNLIES